jgi:hypothetical protein
MPEDEENDQKIRRFVISSADLDLRRQIGRNFSNEQGKKATGTDETLV